MPTHRKSKVITFSLPPEMAEQVRQLMQEEGRTMSELIREALRLYMEDRSGETFCATDNGVPASWASPPRTWSDCCTSTAPKAPRTEQAERIRRTYR